MKIIKSFITLLIGGGAIYFTLSWNPSLLITLSAEPAKDTTNVVPAVPEVSPSVAAPDTTKADSIK